MQGDLFTDLPIATVDFAIELNAAGDVFEAVAAETPRDGMMSPCSMTLTAGIVLTQSCDVQDATRILLAPVDKLELKAKEENQWGTEIQPLATSLRQPNRIYLPDDPELELPRRVAECNKPFLLRPSDLNRFVERGKRVAALNDEGVSYLQHRLSVIFSRVARDDYAWPSKADLQLKEKSLQKEIERRKGQKQGLATKIAGGTASEEEVARAEELGDLVAFLEKELTTCTARIAAFVQ